MKLSQFSAILVLLLSFFVLQNTAAAYSGGDGSAGNPYQIATVADLLYLGAHTGDYGANFILTADINLADWDFFSNAIIAPDTTNTDYTFVGTPFTGVFDGNGYTISNFKITTSGTENSFLGLFGKTDTGSEIKNLRLEDVNITGGNNSMAIGLLAGDNDGNISNCYSNGTVSAGNLAFEVGGLVGWNNGNISNCHSAATVSVGGGASQAGGLVGYAAGNISNCYATGEVSGKDGSFQLGGLAGYNYYSTIDNCYATGRVSGGDGSYDVGGLVGYNHYGEVINCHSSGAVSGETSSYELGGLAGQNDANISNCYSTGTVSGGNGAYYLGGLVGRGNSGTISNCYSTGNVSGTGDPLFLGGLMGQNDVAGSIYNCYSTGAVAGADNSQLIGGLVGANMGNINVSYSTGSITGISSLGGLAGFNGGTINNCHSSVTVTGGDHAGDLGGLAGDNVGDINNCYSTGTVSSGNGAFLLGGLVGENESDGNISSCYFLSTSGPKNGYGTPLTGGKMKQQKSFVGWDFNDVWWIAEGTSFPKLFWQLIDVTKCTVTAGSKPNKDKISFSGTMDTTDVDFNDANANNNIKVTVCSDYLVLPCEYNFPIDANTFKKGKYKCSRRDSNITKSFTYDVKTRKFAFSVSDVNLLGLCCPVTAKIDIGDYNGIALLDETIVNGKTVPISIKLMTGVKNVLRVDKCTVRQSTRDYKDTLSAKGAFTVENPDPCMAHWITDGLVITLGSQQWPVPKDNLKAGKGNSKTFSCTNVKITDPNGTVTASFNFNTCAFTTTIKDANIPPLTGDVGFGAAFADFNEVRQVTIP